MSHALQQIAKPAIVRKATVRRRKILAAAANQINARGAGGVSLDLVANAAGLSRNALYHYVSDRAELAYLCFTEACDAMLTDLKAANLQSRDPASQLETLIRINMTSRSDQLAVLGDYDALPDNQRLELRTKETQIRSGIAEIISRGVSTKRFREVDPQLVADCLLGMVNWVRLAERWLEDESSHDRLARSITDLLLNGFANGEKLPTDRWPIVQHLTATNLNPFDRDELKEQKRQQILGIASQLFNRRGVDGTSLNDIVVELGATKGAFYHYFKDKNELVIECYRRAFGLYDAFVDAASTSGSNGFEKAMIINHLNCQAQLGLVPPLTLQTGLDTLSEPIRSQFIARSRAVWGKVQHLVDAGIADGSCRQIDVRAATEAAAGPFFWIARNNEPSGHGRAWKTADAICDVIGYGILATDTANWVPPSAQA